MSSSSCVWIPDNTVGLSWIVIRCTDHRCYRMPPWVFHAKQLPIRQCCLYWNLGVYLYRWHDQCLLALLLALLGGGHSKKKHKYSANVSAKPKWLLWTNNKIERATVSFVAVENIRRENEQQAETFLQRKYLRMQCEHLLYAFSMTLFSKPFILFIVSATRHAHLAVGLVVVLSQSIVPIERRCDSPSCL